MQQARNLRELLMIRSHNAEYIHKLNGELGSALGLKNGDGDPCIIIFVPRKINKKWLKPDVEIRDRLEGPGDLWCPIDVVEGGKYEPRYEPAYVDVNSGVIGGRVPADTADDIIGPKPLSTGGRVMLREQLRGWTDKIHPGAQLYHADGWFGTLGCFAYDGNGKLGLITNEHVAGRVGDRLYYPVRNGVKLATVQKTIEYLPDEVRFPGTVDQPADQYRVDCAFAKIDPDRLPDDIDPRMPVLTNRDMVEYRELGDPLPLDLDTMGPIGEQVLSVGRTRSFQKGRIAAVAYSWVDEEFEWREPRSIYTDYLIIGDEENGEVFSDKGDSGKLIVTKNGLRPVALLWGGWKEKLRHSRMQEKWTYAIDINIVTEKLGVTIANSLEDE